MSIKTKTSMGIWLADRMKSIRENKSISQQELADAVGLSRAQIANIESGLMQVSVESLMEITTFLDISLDEMKKYYKPSERRKKKLIAFYENKIRELNAM